MSSYMMNEWARLYPRFDSIIYDEVTLVNLKSGLFHNASDTLTRRLKRTLGDGVVYDLKSITDKFNSLEGVNCYINKKFYKMHDVLDDASKGLFRVCTCLN